MNTPATGLRSLQPVWAILLGAATVLSLSLGLRQSLGIFMPPITQGPQSIGITVAQFTAAVAVQNLAWGLLQPLAGAWSARVGFRPLMVAGAALYIAALVVLANAQGLLSVVLSAGVMIGASLACTGSALTMSVATRVVSPANRSLVLGLVSAVGSLGAMVAAPLGQTLAASQTVPTLLKLANLETMTVKAQISEADVTRVKAGMPVYFTLLGDADTRYHGTLRTVELAPTNINEQATSTTATSNAAVYYYALFDVPNPDHTLRVAMTTQVTIVLGERKQVLTIPQTALGKKLGENEYEVTLIKDDDQKETRRIKTGMKDDIKVEVVSGLTEQDKVKLGQSAPVNGPDVEMML